MPVAWWTGAGAAATGPPVAITADDNKAGHRTAPRCRRRQAVASAGWCRYAWNGIIFIICQVRTGRGACDPTTAWIDSGNISISTHISFRDPTSFRYNHPVRLPLLLSAFCVSAVVCPAAEPPRPNILVILTDDLGFSDLGCYGSEIETPNLDRLAANGLRFTQFYNTAKCHSSRVSLLSGRWCHQAGDESLRRAVTIPEVLAPAGYFTAMTGKWHLSKTADRLRLPALLRPPLRRHQLLPGDKTFRLNGEPWTVPGQGLLHHRRQRRLRPQVPRRGAAQTEETLVPLRRLQRTARPAATARSRTTRNTSAATTPAGTRSAPRGSPNRRKLGLFGQRRRSPRPRPDHIPAWDTLTPAIRDWETRRMTAYAGLIDRVDQELGRLVADLEQAGELDNTLILFFSDNGACPYDRRSSGTDREPYEPDVTWSDSTGWAWARNTPVPLLQAEPVRGRHRHPGDRPLAGRSQDASRAPSVHTPAHLVDVLPTLAELAGAKVPDTFPGREPTPLAGISLAPILAGNELPDAPADPPALRQRPRPARRRLEARQLPQPAVGALQHRHRPHRTARPRRASTPRSSSACRGSGTGWPRMC